MCFQKSFRYFLTRKFRFSFYVLMLFFILGISCSTQILTYPLIAEHNPSTLTGTAEGLAAVLIMSGGAFFQPLFGYLVEWNWNGLTLDGIPQYSLLDYHTALYLFPITLLICLTLLRFIRETSQGLFGDMNIAPNMTATNDDMVHP